MHFKYIIEDTLFPSSTHVLYLTSETSFATHRVQAVEKVDYAIHRININAEDNAIGFPYDLLSILIYPVGGTILLLNNLGQAWARY